MENLAYNLRVVAHKNNKAFEKVHALIVFFKYKKERNDDFFEVLDTEMLSVVTDMINNLREFRSPIFFDFEYSKEAKAWIQIVKTQKEEFQNFLSTIKDVELEGDSDYNKLEKLDNLAIDMVELLEKKKKFYENLEM